MRRWSRHRAMVILPALLIASCIGPASRMAAQHEGVTRSQIGHSDTRLRFMALGPEILETKTEADGCLTEIYRVRRKKGSSLRSFTHGILSIATLGIWNVVGTPIEGFLSNDDSIVFRVFYDRNEKAKKVEIQG